MEHKLLERIEINPQILAGKPVIKGTRISVELILRMLSQGISVEEILEEYPHLTEEDVKAALSLLRGSGSRRSFTPWKKMNEVNFPRAIAKPRGYSSPVTGRKGSQ